jgi:hypothetical protein
VLAVKLLVREPVAEVEALIADPDAGFVRGRRDRDHPTCGMQSRAETTSHDPQKLPLQRGTTPHAARGAYRHRRRPLREEPTGSQLTAERAYPFGGVDLFLGAGGHGYRVPTRERSDQRHLARSEEDRVAVTIKL